GWLNPCPPRARPVGAAPGWTALPRLRGRCPEGTRAWRLRPGLSRSAAILGALPDRRGRGPVTGDRDAAPEVRGVRVRLLGTSPARHDRTVHPRGLRSPAPL